MKLVLKNLGLRKTCYTLEINGALCSVFFVISHPQSDYEIFFETNPF